MISAAHRLGRLIFLGLGCLLVGTPLSAQVRDSEPRKVVLPNGGRLILKPEAGTDVVTLVLAVRTPEAGSEQEEATAELVARALFFGSRNRSYDRIARAVSEVGGVLETLRTPRYTAITVVVLPEQVRNSIYMLCEALKNADFTPAALERARASLNSERLKRDRDGYAAAHAALVSRRPERFVADDAALQRVTQAAAQDYFRRVYVPDNLVVAAAGRFLPEEVRHDFETDLFDWKRKPSANATSSITEGGLFSPALKLTIAGKAAYAMVATDAPDVADPDYPAFTVLQTLLGVGHASRLFRQVRDTQGFGYDVGAAYAAERSEPMVAYLEWDAARLLQNTSAPVVDPLALLNAQLDSVLTSPPAETELKRARNLAIGRDRIRHERTRERAFFLAWYEVMGPGFAYDAEFPDRLASVTAEDVRRVARKYLSRRTTMLATPEARKNLQQD